MIGDDPRSFAIGVIRKLQEAGFEALFAGGCVRDQLMGREPKDYDVATSATPEQVREVFGRRKTIAIGAAFGVITVIGSQQSGNVEIATFRADGDYSDGHEVFCYLPPPPPRQEEPAATIIAKDARDDASNIETKNNNSSKRII